MCAGNPHVGVAVGVVVALFLIACAVVAAVFYLRKNKVIGIKSSGGVSFDNPSFFGRRNPPANDTLQIIQHESTIDGNAEGTATSSGVSSSSHQQQQGSMVWKQETLHAAAATEVAPTIYEELRLGTDGAGFKRLK